jgi:hypothetical protein
MKVVKLNKTHRLFHKGYTHAFRFPNWCKAASKVEDLLRDTVHYSEWGYYWPATKDRYWIGIKDESILTLLLLKMNT